jgi:transcriptional repressor NrdR
MQCPFCGHDNDKVVDSRSSEGGKTVRRRRQCLACHRRFTTYERPEEALRLTVLKKDGTREPYERGKLIAGLEKACSKRPVGGEQLRAIVEAVEEDIYRHFEREVPSTFIGDTVSRQLRGVDKIAYVRFASVYRNFGDLGELIQEATEVNRAAPVGKDQKPLFEPPTPPPGNAPGALRPPGRRGRPGKKPS